MNRLCKTVVISAILMLVMAATVCAAPITITHLTYENHAKEFHQYLNTRAELFNKQNPDIKIEIIVGVHDKFNTMVMGGVAPDVIDLPDFDYLGPTGVIMDLRSLIERDNIAEIVGKPIINFITMPNGAIYSTPMELGSTPAFFNRTLFNQAGLISPDKMGKSWTWDAAMNAAKKLTSDADGDGMPEIYGIDRPWGYWRRAVFQAGGDFIQVDKSLKPVKSLVNSKEVAAGIEYVAKFYQSKTTAHLMMSWDAHTAFYFWKGKSALDFCDGMGIVSAYLQKVDWDWDFTLQPAGPAGPLGEIGAGGPHIVASSKNVEAAWKWLKFIAFNEENARDFISITGRLPAYKKAQPYYPVLCNLKNKNYNAIFEQTMYPSPRQYPVPKEINSRYIGLDAVWKGAEPVETVLQRVHETWTAYIKEQQAK